MSQNVPTDIAKEIKEFVYEEAEKYRYLSQSRTSNGAFIEKLVNKAEVGGRLATFMPKTEVKTYIKDAILNRYSKDKLSANKPSDLETIINTTIGFKNAELVEESAHGVKLYESSGKLVVVAHGTYLKWETALRKALVYIAKMSPAQNPNEASILLTLFASHKKVPSSDCQHLAKAVSFLRGFIYIYGES